LLLEEETRSIRRLL